MLKETIWKAGVKGMKLIQREPDSIIFWDQTETENASLLYVFFFNLQEILYLFNVITKFKETIWSPVLRAWHQFRKNQIQKFFFHQNATKNAFLIFFLNFLGILSVFNVMTKLKGTIWEAGVKGMTSIQKEPDSIIFWQPNATKSAPFNISVFYLQGILSVFNVTTKLKEII